MQRYDSKAAQRIERSYQTPEIIRQRLNTLDALALRAGERVLDAGCGTGLLAESMAGQVGSQGSVVGVDNSAAMLAVAQQRCAQLQQVELREASITELDFEAQSFDAASCTQVLLYVDQVELALEQLHRLLKPGGRLAIIETDWRGLVLNNQDEALTRRILDAWDGAVASPNLPVKLGAMLRRLGFSALRIEPIPVLNTSYLESNFSAGMVQFFAKNALDKNLISEDESKRWQAQLEQLGAQQEYFFCVNRFLFSAVK